MDFNEREGFRKALLELEGNDLEEEIKQLTAKIIYPKFVYRYRPLSVYALDSLISNKLYFSSAKYYDDPFDTYLYVNFERVERELGFFIKDKDQIQTALQIFSEALDIDRNLLDKLFSNEYLDIAQTSSKIYLREIRNIIQEEMYSICFSELPLNEVLWLKYAQNHHGFVLMYNIEDASSWLCGKDDTCESCFMKDVQISLYPVCYTNEKYDATIFARAIATYKLVQNANPTIREQIISSLGPLHWERERVSLIKNECHKYDYEWRMILPFSSDKQCCIKWKPNAVIVGLKTSEAEKDVIVNAAKKAGIDRIYQSFINDKNELDAYIIHSQTSHY